MTISHRREIERHPARVEEPLCAARERSAHRGDGGTAIDRNHLSKLTLKHLTVIGECD
jgi:hypothetical protein